eukprot:scaffold263_cov120-Isochrysis_galbana.AAC.7
MPYSLTHAHAPSLWYFQAGDPPTRIPLRYLHVVEHSARCLALRASVVHEVHPSSLLVGSCQECRGLRGGGRWGVRGVRGVRAHRGVWCPVKASRPFCPAQA